MNEYWFVYKCRCCGKKFTHTSTRCTENTVMKVLADFSCGKNFTDELDGTLTPYSIHLCDKHTCGYADLIGVTTTPSVYTSGI